MKTQKLYRCKWCGKLFLEEDETTKTTAERHAVTCGMEFDIVQVEVKENVNANKDK